MRVISELVGPIDPLGDSSADVKRFENLKKLVNLTEQLLYTLCRLKSNSSSYEDSVKRVGDYVTKRLEEMKAEL